MISCLPVRLLPVRSAEQRVHWRSVCRAVHEGCNSGYRCEWEILLYPTSGQLTNCSLQLLVHNSSQKLIPLALDTPTGVSISQSWTTVSYQFVLTQPCVVNLSILASNTSSSFYLSGLRSDWPADFTLD
jgi:hypothetical protein